MVRLFAGPCGTAGSRELPLVGARGPARWAPPAGAEIGATARAQGGAGTDHGPAGGADVSWDRAAGLCNSRAQRGFNALSGALRWP